MIMAVVTLSRELGSEGDRIALKIAEQLGYDLVDNSLIVKVAERAGVSVEKAAHFDEHYTSQTVQWLKNFVTPRVGKILVDEGRHIDPETFIEYCRTVIRGLAEKGNVVIVGRAGQFILSDNDTAFHVRVVADMPFRIERVKERYTVNDTTAKEMIKKSDHMRKHYIEQYFHKDWNDPGVYHVIINSSRLGVDDTAAVLIDTVRMFRRSHQIIPGSRDQRGGDRRKGQCRKGDRRASEVGYSSKEIEKMAIREGRPLRSHSSPDQRKRDRRRSLRRMDEDDN